MIQDRLWHNPGVVGVPANDSTPRVWFSILTPGPEPRTLVIEHLALVYDYATAAVKMRAVGLPEGYADALVSGLWPSCDVLPSQEAKAQGGSLQPGKVVWRPEGPAPTSRSTWAGRPGRPGLRCASIRRSSAIRS